MGPDEIVEVKFPVFVVFLISTVLLDLQAPKRIWQTNRARQHRKVFNRTYDHSV
jgi:hypothetical protein